jgi:hypothetical protein
MGCIMSRKSNTLAETKQAFRVEAVHCLLQESLRRAEEQFNQLAIVNRKIDAQAEASELILSTVKKVFTPL